MSASLIDLSKFLDTAEEIFIKSSEDRPILIRLSVTPNLPGSASFVTISNISASVSFAAGTHSRSALKSGSGRAFLSILPPGVIGRTSS